MNRRRLISTLLILSLLSALFPDRGQAAVCLCRDHICTLMDGATGDGGTTERKAPEPVKSCCDAGADVRTAFRAPEADIPASPLGPDRVDAATMMNPVLLSSHMLCCGDESSQRTAAVDAAPVPMSLSWSPLLFSAEMVRILQSFELLGSQYLRDHKVESSPPFMAASTRHTYLHTSVFLI